MGKKQTGAGPSTKTKRVAVVKPADETTNTEDVKVSEGVESNVPANAEAILTVVQEDNTPAPRSFALAVKQFDDEGRETVCYGIKFGLPADIAGKMDFIIGTALDQLFKKMDLAKATKTKLFDSRKELHLSINTEDKTVLDFGSIDQVFLKKVKVNNGERSKLSLIETISAIGLSMMTEIKAVRATTLREDAKLAVANRFGKLPSGKLSQNGVISMANAEISMAVTEEGKLQEVAAPENIEA